ncbi:MAG: TonB-dependent receptor [Crocinitomicaceae bacterium]|nr:TonB-dependent receptor [Crocinitomicaceae bacterium]
MFPNILSAQKPSGKGGQGRQMGKEAKLSILGRVIDEEKEPIPFVSIGVFNSVDSSLVTGGTTDDKGYFELKAPKGSYYLQLSFLSFDTRVIPNVAVDKSDVNLKTVTMKHSATSLEAVNIEAEKSQMVLKLDKRVFNVGSDLSNRGKNAIDILENVPSVDVDVEGNLSLRNSQNVRILIDGKPSSLVGVSSNDALRLLQSDMIERVEVITNPSARYDAEGEVGIINIVLKKEKKKGLNGIFEVNAGYPNRLGTSFNVNYRKNKLNLFTGYSINYRERPGQGETYHVFYQPDTTYSYRSTRDHSRNGLNHNVRLGGSYDFNKYNSLSVSSNYSYSSGVNTAKLVYKDYSENNELSQTSVRDEIEDQNRESAGLRLNYTKLFKRPDMKWSIDANHFFSFSFEDALIDQTSDLPGVAATQQKAKTEEDETNTLFQSDFEMPIGKESNGKFEMGIKANIREISNDYLVEDNVGGTFVPIPELDNHMVYNENIYAAYIMVGNKTKNLSYQAGLRYEYSDVKSDFRRTNEVNHRTYGNLFPSANVSYEFKKNSFLQASYSKRVSRPRHWYLFPFYNLSDNRNIARGNPNINPTFTDAFELGYMKKWDRANFLISPYYRYSTGVVERILLADSNQINYRFPVNLGFRNAFGLEVSGSGDLYKWWTMNGSFNFYREITEGSYKTQDYSADTYAWTARVVSKWKVKKAFSFQISGRYHSPQKTIQGTRKSMYKIDLAGALDVLKGNGTLTLSVRDLFNSRIRRSVTNGPDFYDESDFQWMSRFAQLTFSYRLNQKKRRGRSGGEFDGGDMGR